MQPHINTVAKIKRLKECANFKFSNDTLSFLYKSVADNNDSVHPSHKQIKQWQIEN